MPYFDVYTNKVQASKLTYSTEVACAVSAKNILVEDLKQPNHENRLIWAKDVLFNGKSPDKAAQMLWYLVLSNDGLQYGKDIPDDLLQKIVDSLIDQVALG